MPQPPPSPRRHAIARRPSGVARSPRHPPSPRRPPTAGSDRTARPRRVRTRAAAGSSAPARSSAAAAAAVVLIAGAVIGIGWSGPNGWGAQREMAAIAEAPDAQSQTHEVEGGGEITLVSSADQGRSGVVVEGLPELDADQTYELWYIDDAGAASAGTFDVSGERDLARARRVVHPGRRRRRHRRTGGRFAATHDRTDRRHPHVVEAHNRMPRSPGPSVRV